MHFVANYKKIIKLCSLLVRDRQRFGQNAATSYFIHHLFCFLSFKRLFFESKSDKQSNTIGYKDDFMGKKGMKTVEKKFFGIRN